MIKLDGQLSRYQSFFSELGIKISDQNDLIAHKTVSYVVTTQFRNVKSPSCVVSIEKKLGQFTRNLQAIFDHVYINVDDYNFPDFVLDLAAIQVEGYLSSYHTMIVRLLKLLIIIIEKKDKKNEVYEFALDYDSAALEPEMLKVMFSENCKYSRVEESGANELDLKQLHNDLKEFF
ncbi:hypothetical protein [Pseudoalteromonas spongiae]|uniref:Uncharacterized protein n=1 Tax=Pseudoalteromonas spongiae TaxID=298657 RepID=A0ABU8ETP2_9GAMM